MRYSEITYSDFLQLGIALPKWAKELSEEEGFPSVSAVSFYTDIFQNGLAPKRKKGFYEDFEYRGIAIEKGERINQEGKKEGFSFRHYIYKDNKQLFRLINRSKEFCMIAPVSYAGESKDDFNARDLYAMVIEVDNLKGKTGLKNLLFSFERPDAPKQRRPKPTYMVCSGNGVHLYYVFENPVKLWSYTFSGLQKAKKYLTTLIWDKNLVSSSEVEYEAVTQNFRCVGTLAKDGKSRAVAFKIGEKITVEYINSFLPEELQIITDRASTMTREEAKEKYEYWYRWRIEKKGVKDTYMRHQGIYHNWKKKVLEGAIVGHRYYCLENLCSLALQCDIDEETLKADCEELKVFFNNLTNVKEKEFTDQDMRDAMKTYYRGKRNPIALEKAFMRNIDVVSAKTAIPIERAKRNGRKRYDHLHTEVFIIDGKKKKNLCRENRLLNAGRKSKRDIVQEWRELHPEKTKVECMKELGISRATVYRHWDI